MGDENGIKAKAKGTPSKPKTDERSRKQQANDIQFLFWCLDLHATSTYTWEYQHWQGLISIEIIRLNESAIQSCTLRYPIDFEFARFEGGRLSPIG